MRDRWLLSREKRLDSAEQDKSRPVTSRQQHRLLRMQLSQAESGKPAAPASAALPHLSLRPTTTASSFTRRVAVRSLQEIPTVDRLGLASKERYSVQWGRHRSPPGTDSGDSIQQEAEGSNKSNERDAYDKESFSFPTVSARPPLPTLSAEQSRGSAVLHTVHTPQRSKQFISKRDRKLAFSHDFSTSSSSSSCSATPLNSAERPRRAATAHSTPSSKPAAVQRSTIPHLSFALYHHVVQPAESIAEERVDSSQLPTPPLLATPVFSPFASPKITPHLTPAHSSLSSPTSSPYTSSVPLSSSTLHYYDDAVWSDLLAFHASASSTDRHERLLYVLGQCGATISAAEREALHGGLIERYVKERPGYVSQLVWVEQVWRELQRTVAGGGRQAEKEAGVNAIVSWLSADMALHVVDGMAELRSGGSGLDSAPINAASLFHSLLSVVASHAYSHHPHFPATPYHLQQQQLTLAYTDLQQQHAADLVTSKQKAEHHAVECQRWQTAIDGARQRYTRTIVALSFMRWKHVTGRGKWRRGSEASAHAAGGGDIATETLPEGEWMQRVYRMQQRYERRFQSRALFVAWRAQTLCNRLEALRSDHSLLLSSYPLCQSRLLSLQSQQTSLLAGYAASWEQLQDSKRHLVMLGAQEVAYGAELRQEEAGVQGVQELVSVFDVLREIAREEVELGAVQLLTGGWQDGRRLAHPVKAGGEEEQRAEEDEWRHALDAEPTTLLDASEPRTKKRSMDVDGLGHTSAPVDTAEPNFADRLLSGWLAHEAELAGAMTEPFSATVGSPAERYVMQRRERLLSSLRALSSTYSTAYGRKQLLQLHFLRGERMEERLGAITDSARTHRSTTSGSSDGDINVVALDELLRRREDEERVDDEVILSVAADDAHISRGAGSRTRVPSSPHVSVMAHSLRRSQSTLHRPMQHSFSSTMPISTLLVEEQPAATATEAVEALVKPEEVGATDGSAAEVKEREADGHERRKKKPLLTIQINTQRSTLALSTIPSPSAASQPAVPASPPQPPSRAVTADLSSAAAPGSAVPGSAKTRFHRSNLRARGGRATSMFSASGGALLPSSASPLPQLPADDADATTPRAESVAAQSQMSLTAPLPLVAVVERAEDVTVERSPGGTSRGVTAYSCAHQLIVLGSGVIVRASRRAPVAFHPFVLQSLDRLLLQPSTHSAAPTSPLSDLHLAALHWLMRALPGMPFRALSLVRHIETDNIRLAAMQPLTHSKQMQHTVTTLRAHRRMLILKKQQAVRGHALFDAQLAAVEQSVTARLMERIRVQEKEEAALGGLRAQEAADSSEYLLVSSALAAHNRLGSVAGGVDLSLEPLSSTSPAMAPHHRQRSSMASFDASGGSAAGRPTSRHEPYTRIRSVITSMLQTHGTRAKVAAPAQPAPTRTRASTVTGGARANGRSQSAASELYSSHPHLSQHSHRHSSTDFTATLSERPQAIPEDADEDDLASLPLAPTLSPRPVTDHAMAGLVSEVQRCERILGHFHADLRRIYRHAIDSDTATQHKALTAAAANSASSLAAMPPAPAAKPPGEQYAMTGLQFLRFVRQYRLYSASVTPHAVDLLYAAKLASKQAVYEQVMRQSGSVDSLNYDDWLELLVSIAVQTYRDEADVSVRVWRLLHDVLSPDVAGKLSGDYRVELSTTLCYTVLDKHSLWLQSVYASYATHSFQSSSLYRLHDAHSLNLYSINTMDERCMDETDWQHFVADSSLLAASVLTAAGCRSVWSNVQTDLQSEDYFGGERCMVYSEFTEALCVLGHHFERSPYVSVESKLDGLLAWLQSVPAMEERRHKHAVWAPGQQAPGLGITQQVPANISALPLT